MTRAERWVRLAAGRSLRVRAVDERDGACSVELQVLADRAELGASCAALVLPLGRARDVAKALAAIAGELGVRP